MFAHLDQTTSRPSFCERCTLFVVSLAVVISGAAGALAVTGSNRLIAAVDDMAPARTAPLIVSARDADGTEIARVDLSTGLLYDAAGRRTRVECVEVPLP